MKLPLLKTSHLLPLLLLVFFASCHKSDDNTPASKDYLIDVTAEKHYSRSQITSIIDGYLNQSSFIEDLLQIVIPDVKVAAITYKTTGVDGKQTVASGVIAYPASINVYYNLLSIQHSTLDIDDAPSKVMFYYEMLPVIQNNVIVIADYIGYGVSQNDQLQTPYLNVKSTGIVCADMIEAAKEYMAMKGIRKLSDEVRLIGYSQGGHATLATVLELEKRGKQSTIKSVDAGGGAYDLSKTMDVLLARKSEPYLRSGYIPFLFNGLIFGDNLSVNDKNIYNTYIFENDLFNIFATKQLSSWHQTLGTDITKVISPDFYDPSYADNQDIMTIIESLSNNSIVNKNQPSTAINIYHSQTDQLVPYANATSLKESWPSVKLIDLTSTTHETGGVEFMLRYAGLWDLYEKIK